MTNKKNTFKIRKAIADDTAALARLHVKTFNQFYERMGAAKLLGKKGEFHGGYGWKDLQKLIAICSDSEG